MTPSTVCIYRQCVINDLSARWLLKLTVIPCVKHAATLPWEISGRFPTNTAQQPDFLHYLVVAVYIYHPPLLERGIQNAVRVKYNKNIQQKHTHTHVHTQTSTDSHTHTHRDTWCHPDRPADIHRRVLRATARLKHDYQDQSQLKWPF